jgi:integrase
MPLTDAQCRNTKPIDKTQKISDGGGLHLQIRPTGTRVWLCSYRWQGKQRTANFGKYPAVSLARARVLRSELKLKLSEGIDPALKEGQQAPSPDDITFKDAAHEWFRSQESRWVQGYAARIWSRIQCDVLPEIGEMKVGEVEPADVLRLLRKIEDRGALEMAKRVRQTISAICRYAVANGWAKQDPAAPLAGAMRANPPQVHRAALKENELPEFFKALAAYTGDPATALGLKFLAHTFVRTSELRFATWDEFSGDIWRIPSERMKVKMHDHIVPLSIQAQAILSELKKLAGSSKWVLPGTRGDHKPISANTLIFGLYRLGYHSRATVHGFRGTASTILNESNLFRADAIERQLAHVPANEVRAAYNAALYLEERKKMMQWYSDKLDALERIGTHGDLSKILS